MSLEIDFAPPSKSRPSWRMGLWAMMLTLLLGLTWSLTSETEAGLPHSYGLIPSEEEIRSINSAIDDLNFPWLALLKAIEESGDECIRILQLDADVRDLRMTIKGEARNGNAVLELPDRLRDKPVIEAARVTSQTPAANSGTGNFPLRFALEASLRIQEGDKP